MLRKTLFIVFIILAAFRVQAQDRGFKPINVKIEGSETKLYNASYALIIGVSTYTNGWKSLPGVNEDVAAVKLALETQGFICTVVKDPNSTSLGKAFGDFIAKYGQDQDNRLLFYYAGHGHTVKNSYGGESGYIVPADAPNPNKDAAAFQNTAMEMQQIEIFAKRIQSKHALFLFDACFSGSLFAMTRAASELINYKTSRPVRQFITSGSAEETVPDKSIFRQQFVTAITTNEADYNKDGYVTGTELGEFLQTNVINYSYNNQHPQYGKIRDQNLDKGDFVFVLSGSDKFNSKNVETASNPIAENKHIEVTKNNETFTDSRDGKTYKIVKIGTQTWMAENLAFNPTTGNFWKYYNIESNIEIYGNLYDWETATNICPLGWHLPSYNEWSILIGYLGANQGSKLKSSFGWNKSSEKNGTNESGFSALPGGYRKPSGQFKGNGFIGSWWSSTMYDKENAWSLSLSFDNDSAGWEKYNLYGGFSVRCIKGK